MEGSLKLFSLPFNSQVIDFCPAVTDQILSNSLPCESLRSNRLCAGFGALGCHEKYYGVAKQGCNTYFSFVVEMEIPNSPMGCTRSSIG